MAYALAGIGPAAAPVFATMIPIVQTLCGRKAERQSLHFVENLEPAGEAVIGVLIAGMLSARDTGLSARIARGLGDMGLAAVLPLYAAFAAAADDRQRSALARALGKVGPDAGLALGILLDRLTHVRDDDARAVMAEAIAGIGLRSSASLPALRSAFRSAESCRALGRIADAVASLGSEAVSFLVEEFEAADTGGRTQIARVLGEVGTDAAQAVIPLATAAKGSGDRALVIEVAEVLKKIGAPAEVLFTARIAALQYDPHGYWTRDVLTDMQTAIGSGLRLPDQDVRDLVALLVATGDSPTGRSIAKLLGSVGKAAAEPLLRALDQVREQRTRIVLFQAGSAA